MYEKLEEFLASRHAQYQVVPHAGAVTAQEQAAAAHTSGWAVAKVVIVKERDGLVMAVVPAASLVDLDRLKGLIGHDGLRLATVEEVHRLAPACAPGAIPPFGALFGLRTFVDRKLLLVGEVTMPAGDFATSIRMKSSEFERLATPLVGDFAVAESIASGAGWR
jgi:Ala-tRNA(Pro) deacylase